MGFRDLAVSNPIGGIYTTILKSGAETALFPTDFVGTEKKIRVHTAGGYVKSSALQVSGISWEYARL